jgi:hypothetical protein
MSQTICATTLVSLIPDVLRIIFSSLPPSDLFSGRLARVCKQWQKVFNTLDNKIILRKVDEIAAGRHLRLLADPPADTLPLESWRTRIQFSLDTGLPLAGRPKDLVLMVLVAPEITGLVQR